VPITYTWRGPLTNDEFDALHAEGFEHERLTYDWVGQLERHSLGWVCARDQAGALVGVVNVAWDGGSHAFVLDTLVTAAWQRQGIATALVAAAEREARAAGCEWLHVDFDEHLTTFYLEHCGFTSTPAGVIRL
jgi:GNAT superfamily N-acetyltransferase